MKQICFYRVLTEGISWAGIITEWYIFYVSCPKGNLMNHWSVLDICKLVVSLGPFCCLLISSHCSFAFKCICYAYFVARFMYIQISSSAWAPFWTIMTQNWSFPKDVFFGPFFVFLLVKGGLWAATSLLNINLLTSKLPTADQPFWFHAKPLDSPIVAPKNCAQLIHRGLLTRWDLLLLGCCQFWLEKALWWW